MLMLDKLPIDETRGKRNAVLQKDTGNSVDGASKKAGSFKENGNKMNTYIQIQSFTWYT